jgi:DNA-binding transcriptional MerR regulator
MDWSIQQIARLAGTSSRTLRHYDDIGLLPPSRIGSNGYRYYDQDALTRLQRVLLLRDLGLGLPAIAEVLEHEPHTASALHRHLDWLRKEQERLTKQISSVETTILKLEGGEQLMAEEILDGFDHTQYEAEVTERWGADAYRNSDRWYRSLTKEQRQGWLDAQLRIAEDYGRAATDGLAADSDEVQAITQRHFEWLSGIPGTPGYPQGPSKQYFTGLGELYVADERFGANYDKHGEGAALLVRDAMAYYADRNL